MFDRNRRFFTVRFRKCRGWKIGSSAGPAWPPTPTDASRSPEVMPAPEMSSPRRAEGGDQRRRKNRDTAWGVVYVRAAARDDPEDRCGQTAQQGARTAQP